MRKKDQEYRELYERAVEAGEAAASECAPTPMIVQQRANPFDPNSPVIYEYPPVMGGVCGFAWVKVRPANSGFARWLKRQDIGYTDSYEGGYRIPVRGYGQSMELKEAYAWGFAEVLREAGFYAYAGSKED